MVSGRCRYHLSLLELINVGLKERSNRMKLLVCGGAGFIVQIFSLLSRSMRIMRLLIFDKLTTAGNLDNLTVIANTHITNLFREYLLIGCTQYW